MRVNSDGDMAVSVAAFDTSGVLVAAAAMDTSATAGGNSYEVAYSAGTPAVSISWLGAVSVDDSHGLRLGPGLAVWGTPTSGPVRFKIQAADDGRADHLEIFDLSGRRVADVEIGPGSSSASVVTWEWRNAGCGPGIYFARLQARPQRIVRFVVLR